MLPNRQGQPLASPVVVASAVRFRPSGVRRPSELLRARREILTGVDLSVSIGVTGILGPNGAGKTTLVRLLATLERPSEGSLSLFGTDISLAADATIAGLRGRIGYVPQHFMGIQSFTVRDFMRYMAWLRQIPDVAADGEIAAALGLVELGDSSATQLRKLSGGMLRRVGIAQAVLGSPDLVLLDEPTAGLDPRQRLQFRRFIVDIGQRAAVVITTHLPDDIAATSGRLLVMNEGKMTFSGTHDELAHIGQGRMEIGASDLERGYLSVLDDA